MLGLRTILLFFTISFWPMFGLGQGVPCQCPPISCGPCEYDSGLDFYTEKCGPLMQQTRSCKKPACTKVADHAACSVRHGLSPEVSSGPAPVPQVENTTVAETSTRAPASTVVKTAPSPPPHTSIGKFVLAAGKVDVERGGSMVRALPGGVVYLDDTVVTADDGRAKIIFIDSNELNITPKSRVTVNQFVHEPEKKEHRTLLKLVYGTIRSKVRQKYDRQGKNTYQVQTRTAIAGVRGTEFVTSFSITPKEWKTAIHTLEGEVNLHGTPQQQVDVGAAHMSTFIVAKPSSEQVEDVASAVQKGYLQKVKKLKKSEIDELNKKTRFLDEQFAPNEREPASEAIPDNEVVCTAPRGAFNSCSWTCENNGLGEKKCRTDRAEVRCVRRICRANGVWAEATRLPASQADFCDGQRVRVQACGDYW